MVIFKAWWLLFLGLCVGSFLNCWVYRLNHGLSVKRGRSFCPNCQHKLAWFDNIPLLSFAWLKGHCRYCRSPIGIHYPLVELAAGLLTVLVISYQSSVISLILAYLLLAIFVSDWLYQTIPDQIVYPAIVLTIFFHLRGSFFTSEESWLPLRFSLPPSEVSFWLTALGATGFFYFLVLITHGRGMGMGDVKLAGLMGLILGWPKIALAITLAFLTGAIIGVILVLRGKKSMRSQIAFGPFLVAATLVGLFWGEKIIGIWGY